MLRSHCKEERDFRHDESSASVPAAERRKIIRDYLLHHKLIFQGGLVLLLFLAAALMSVFARTTGESPALVLETAEETVQAEQEETGTQETEETNSDIFVYVCGAVESPGVVCLNTGDRLIDAVNAAGGLREDADMSQINLAREAVDGEQITVLTKEEVQALSAQTESASDQGTQTASTSDSSSQQENLININTASATELKALPGVGDVIAENIVRYREENGLFESIEEIKEVSRIGDKIFESIQDMICVS